MAKTIVATGTSSGLGFEAVKQLLSQQETDYNFILGVQNTTTAQTAFEKLPYNREKHTITLLPLELTDLRTVKKFAARVLQLLDTKPIDILLLNAALVKTADEPRTNDSRYNEPFLVNHLSQHYLLHLLRPRLTNSHTRIIFVSSGSLSSFKDTASLDSLVKAPSPHGFFEIYPATKFIQLLSAHWWRRELEGKCTVLAVSPDSLYGLEVDGPNEFRCTGFIPTTGLSRNVDLVVPPSVMKDAKTIEEGASSILTAFTRTDLPDDVEQIFLTSWGEWWPKDRFGLTLDRALQDEWAFERERIEREEGVE
ncbi:hypothetical protein FKW77_007090 [Venturia effusa]|uniref:Uncharacterized protein n=1 Tax=Venturia effusa TaxID=50376 RepID=A0A517KZM8_9PEZI|nr:hypothetical protein FKW77_007090 [Venturia effusa]